VKMLPHKFLQLALEFIGREWAVANRFGHNLIQHTRIVYSGINSKISRRLGTSQILRKIFCRYIQNRINQKTSNTAAP
jgi:hypothetical protein